MTDTTSPVWFITGAARGLGVHLARAALDAGHQVVATARDGAKFTAALGEDEHLLPVSLDITDPGSTRAAVDAAVAQFGRIDTLVNNAGNFYAGFFEELSDTQFRAQLKTNFFGPVNVTRAVLPVMRRQRSGTIVTLSSTAGIVEAEFTSAYAASKFATEGWMESVAAEVAPFNIRTMLVEPGFFRTELLRPESTQYADGSIDDYAERTTATVAAWKNMDGQQGGDPAKLAAAIIQLAAQDEPPTRFPGGADAVAAFENRAALLLQAAHDNPELSTHLSHDDN